MLVDQSLLAALLRCDMLGPQRRHYISSPQLIEALASVQQDVRSGIFTSTLKSLDFLDAENAHLRTSYECKQV